MTEFLRSQIATSSSRSQNAILEVGTFHSGVERSSVAYRRENIDVHSNNLLRSLFRKENAGFRLMWMIPKSPSTAIIPVETVGNRIFLIRGQKVMLDRDLAQLYEIPTSRLNEQVRRNISRFPKDFMFRLTHSEAKNLISQFAISSGDWGGYRKQPLAFTEQGVAMLSSVLHSPRAIQVNIAIMRAFVQLRQWLSTHADLARKLEEMEQKYDENFRTIFEAIQALMTPEVPEVPENKNKIGFRLE